MIRLQLCITNIVIDVVTLCAANFFFNNFERRVMLKLLLKSFDMMIVRVDESTELG